ncbi:tRNA (guanosine(37)-N1)-methyltransferase TrmD [Candidatus Gottesmanbacteria bacterium]|nr:tRNA (guanosine(37)-N1)-methyltransferase TrmD [Candidatus Gottesmanbacteria bacterium]
MIISILTLFPKLFTPFLNTSILKRAKEKNLVQFNLINLRDFSLGAYKQVDDTPYGGGVGMILRVDVVAEAILRQKDKFPSHPKKRTILLDPRGKTYTQDITHGLITYDHLILVSGHYESIDERILNFIDESISIGDYVLTGGEIPCLVLADSVTRLIPGVLKNPNATTEESFGLKSDGKRLLSYPQYTRPQVYKGKKVPAILLSGNHQKINKWRKSQSLVLTKKLRPDLLKLTTNN